jgi:hypothetical protein
MENKYYVPSIEEFCVGFEYEEQVKEGIWNYQICSINDFDKLGEFTFRHLLEIRTRVKYLDREDIESLGFKYVPAENKYIQEYFIKDNITIRLYSYNEIGIYKKNFYCGEFGNEYIYYFSGTIKNKSELKKLMKQLGIWKD